MNDHLVQLITTALSALGGITAAYKAFKVGEQIKEVKVSIDGRLEQLLEVTRAESHSRGLTEGIAVNEDRTAAATALALKAAELQAEALKAEALRVAEAVRVADQKAADLQAQVHSQGAVVVQGSPINIIEKPVE